MKLTAVDIRALLKEQLETEASKKYSQHAYHDNDNTLGSYETVTAYDNVSEAVSLLTDVKELLKSHPALSKKATEALNAVNSLMLAVTLIQSADDEV